MTKRNLVLVFSVLFGFLICQSPALAFPMVGSPPQKTSTEPWWIFPAMMVLCLAVCFTLLSHHIIKLWSKLREGANQYKKVGVVLFALLLFYGNQAWALDKFPINKEGWAPEDRVGAIIVLAFFLVPFLGDKSTSLVQKIRGIKNHEKRKEDG
jgi:hypothetical protein